MAEFKTFLIKVCYNILYKKLLLIAIGNYDQIENFFKRRKQEVISSKEQIIEKLWGFDSEAEANHVEVYVSFLRKKLKFIHSCMSITAVRGVGYILRKDQ